MRHCEWREGRHLKKRRKASLGNFYLEYLNQERAKKKEILKGGLVKRGGWLVLQNKEGGAVLGVQTSWRKVTGTGGAGRARKKPTFRGAADKGGAEKALDSWELPRSRRRHWGEGKKGGSLEQWPGVP